jgi:sugar lactone lactonase YvrE
VETPDGRLAAADWDGGVALIEPSGAVRKVLSDRKIFGETLKPNGVFPESGGSFVVTHLSQEHGGVFRLHADGRLEDVLLKVDGMELPPTNFVLRDPAGRMWITVSTRTIPRYQARRPGDGDGFIVLVDRHGPRVVADGLGFANEARVDAAGRFLYVNETFGRRLTRFAISTKGELGERSVVTSFGPGTFPDGLALDSEGGFWITSVFSNRILRVSPDGEPRMVFQDCDETFLADVERRFASGGLAREPFKGAGGTLLGNISSLVFTGPDRRTAVLGSLDDTRLVLFHSPVAGAPPPAPPRGGSAHRR